MSKSRRPSQSILKSDSNQVEEIFSDEIEEESKSSNKNTKEDNSKGSNDDLIRKRIEKSEDREELVDSVDSDDKKIKEASKPPKLPLVLRVLSILHIIAVGILILVMIYFYGEYMALEAVDENNMDNKLYFLYITACGIIAGFLCYSRSLIHS